MSIVSIMSMGCDCSSNLFTKAASRFVLIGLIYISTSFYSNDNNNVMVSAVGKSNPNVIDAPKLTESIKANRTIVVDPNGQGEFTSVQSAVDAVPEGNANWVIIHLRKGKYREKVHIPESKPFIFMRGNGIGRTFITWAESSTNNTESATFRVEASNFIAFGISIKNEAPTGEAQTSQNQSVALLAGGDKLAFYHCGFFSTHNTLFDYKGRHVYDNCYIQGSIDFIFGRAKSFFHECEIFVIGDRRVTIFGSITAQNRESQDEDSGYVFLFGKVYGTRHVYLGRAKGAFSRVIFAHTYLSQTVAPEGWTHWSYEGPTNNLFHAEYKCIGPGSGTLERAPWVKVLDDAEAAPFLTVDFVEGTKWVPVWIYT